MNSLYYDKQFQSKANVWWNTLSINEMKAFEKQFFSAHQGFAIPSQVAEIYHTTQEQSH